MFIVLTILYVTFLLWLLIPDSRSRSNQSSPSSSDYVYFDAGDSGGDCGGDFGGDCGGD